MNAGDSTPPNGSRAWRAGVVVVIGVLSALAVAWVVHRGSTGAPAAAGSFLAVPTCIEGTIALQAASASGAKEVQLRRTALQELIDQHAAKAELFEAPAKACGASVAADVMQFEEPDRSRIQAFFAQCSKTHVTDTVCAPCANPGDEPAPPCPCADRTVSDWVVCLPTP